MRGLHTGLAAGLVAAYTFAAVIPCEPLPGSETPPRAAPTAAATDVGHAAGHHHASGPDGAHASHTGHGDRAEPADPSTGHHAAASDEDERAHCHAPPSLIPRCPCGCDEKSRARTPGGRLDPTSLAAQPVEIEPIPTPEPMATGVAWRGADLAPPDKVPIPVS